MRVLRYLAILGLVFLPGFARALDDMPAGVSTRLTIYGNIFTYNGMTLYRSYAIVDDIPLKSKCTDKKADYKNQPQEMRAYFNLAENPYGHKTCTEKWPLFKAQDGAKPVGEWAIVEREDKVRQWFYQGHPVHFYFEDKLPGQVNGDCPGAEKCSNQAGHFGRVFNAPFDAPGGIRLITVESGVVLADADGKVLYTRDGDQKGKSLCSKSCLDAWQPMLAAGGAKDYGDWSVVDSGAADGSKQWAHRGKPLYTAGDNRKLAVRGSGSDKARLALVYEMPEAPQGVSVAMGPTDAPILVDDQGRTLYYFSCVQSAYLRMSCDRQGDSPAYYQGLCGGPERCAETFQYLIAPAGAKENEIWTVRKIDPSNPTRLLADNEAGTRVWFYSGRPIFRYAGDKGPGDFYGMGVRYGAGTGNLNVILAFVGLETAFE